MVVLRYTCRLAFLCLWLTIASNAASSAAAVDERSCDPSIGSFIPVYDLTPGQPATRLLKTVEFAVKCLSAIKVDSKMAVQHVRALASFYQEYYAFTDIARDPVASPNNNTKVIDRLGIRYYPGKVALASRLTAIADSYVAGNTSIADVVFPVNAAFNTVRDGHIAWYGGNNVLANESQIFVPILNTMRLYLIDPELIGSDARGYGTVQPQVKSVNGQTLVTDTISSRTIIKIGGLEPMKWFVSLVTTQNLLLPFKDVGTRINFLLHQMRAEARRPGTFFFPIAAVGNLASLSAKMYPVEYSDGSKTSWQWAVSIAPALANTSIYNISSFTRWASSAAMLGGPYKAQQVAIGKVTNSSDALAAIIKSMAVLAESSAASAAGPASSTSQQLPAADSRLRRHRQSSRRQLLQQGPYLPPTSRFITDDHGSVIGRYGIVQGSKGQKYAFWKLNSFSLNTTNYLVPWNQLIVMAASLGVDKLIYDMTGNGGGQIRTGHCAAAALFPELILPNNTYPWPMVYDSPEGPLAKYMVDSGVLKGVSPAVAGLVNNITYLTLRSNQLNDNATELATLAAEVVQLRDAIQMLIHSVGTSFSSPKGYTCGVDGGDNCLEQWSILYNASAGFPAAIAAAIADKSFTPALLGNILASFVVASNVFVPYSTRVIPETDTMLDHGELNFTTTANLGSKMDSLVTRDRGGSSETYTNKFYLEDLASIQFPNVSTAPIFQLFGVPSFSPFKQILAAGDGFCGSTCAQFSTMAWTYSKLHPNKPKFKFVTYGGTGKSAEMTPTSFQGGSVMDTDFLSQSWAYYGLTNLVANWSGVEEYKTLTANTGKALFEFPAYNQRAPRFTASAGYQRALGDQTLPLDYLMLPNDLYIKQWYDAWDVYSPDLSELYKATALLFD